MNDISKQPTVELPAWLKYGSVVLSVVGLAALTAIEIYGSDNLNWVSFLVLVLLYAPIQIVVEGILSAYWESPKWVVKIIPILLLVCFYGVVLSIK